MGIMKNALRERIRRKDLYIVLAIGLLLVLSCMSGTVTLEVDGVPVTAVESMVPMMMHVIAVTGGVLAIAVSLRTIPDEYERQTSHLIWVRGISQRKYHGQLAAANVLSSVGALFIMYAAILVFVLWKGEMQIFLRCLPAFVLFAIGTAGVSLFTTALSLFLPSMAVGAISAVVMLGGTMHPVIETLVGILSGVAGKMLRVLSFLLPDLYHVTAQACAFLLGEKVEIHPVIEGLLFCYVGFLILYFFRKKEA